MKIRLLSLALVIVAGCHTSAIPFVHHKPENNGLPEDDLRALALEIEQAVEKGDRDVAITGRGSITLNDEIIQQAIRTRIIRSALVREMRASEFVCEKENGMLYILRSKKYKQATSSRDRDRNAGIVMSENSDRWALYEGIVKSNRLPAGSLNAIQRAFYEARMQCAGNAASVVPEK